VPFHHSQRSVWPVIRCRSGLHDLDPGTASALEIRHAAPGVPIDLSDVGAGS
jgi:hypothetical protein